MSRAFYDSLWSTTTFRTSPAKLVREKWLTAVVCDYMQRASRPVRVLDVGCGRGTLLRKLTRKFGRGVEIAGVDFSRTAIQLNRQELQGSFYIRDFSVETWVEGIPKADIVVAQEVVEHLPVNRQVGFLKELVGLVRKQGLVVVTSPDRRSIQELRDEGESDTDFYRRFEGQPNANLLDPECLEAHLQSAGVEIKLSITVCPYARNKNKWVSAALGYTYFALPIKFERLLTERRVYPCKYRVVVGEV